MKTKMTTLGGAVAVLMLVQPAHAQEDDYRWGIGLMGMSSDSPYGFGEDAVLPFLSFENDWVEIGGPSVDVKLPWISTENLSFALRVDFFGGEGGYDADDAIDAPQLAGMAEREGGIWAGAAMEWKSEVVDLSFAALKDVDGDSDGASLKLEVSRGFFLGERWMVTPRLGATWLDDNAVDYFYGVTAAEATGTRAAYTGEATVNLEAGVSLGYMLAEQHMIMLDLSATKLGDGIADSPIVTDDTLTSVGLGYMFRF